MTARKSQPPWCKPGTITEQCDGQAGIQAMTTTLAREIAVLAVAGCTAQQGWQRESDELHALRVEAWGMLRTCGEALQVGIDTDGGFTENAERVAGAARKTVALRTRHLNLLTDLGFHEPRDESTLQRDARQLRVRADACRDLEELKVTLERLIASLEGDLRVERERSAGLQAEVDRLIAELAKCQGASAAPAPAIHGGWEPTPEGEPFQVALRVTDNRVEMQVLQQPEESRNTGQLTSDNALSLNSVAEPELLSWVVYLRGVERSSDNMVCARTFDSNAVAVAYAANVRALIARANAEWKATKGGAA